MATLINNQALSIEQFARIETELMAIKSLLLDHQRILLEHQRILDALPETIREKIGFKHR